MFQKSLIITLVCVLVDQIIKLIISGTMGLGGSISIIPDFFSVSYVENDGAAWSIFSGNRIFLILISVFALILIYSYFFKIKNIKTVEFISYSVLIGGIIGNLWDRLKYGKVIDYLDFKIFGYNFPVFNFADICIVISVILLLIDALIDKGEKNAKNND